MAEFTNATTALVAAGQNVPLTETAVAGNCGIVHREGAGIVTLRGLTNQCRARYKVSFGANIICRKAMFKFFLTIKNPNVILNSERR